MKKFYLSTLLLLAFLGINGQCMLTPLSLNSRASNAPLIIEGRVISTKGFWNPQHNYIFTSNLVAVMQV
jgi:hypothetical protein